MAKKIDPKQLCAVARKVQADGGNLDNMMAHFFPTVRREDEALWKEGKQFLSGSMTVLRKQLLAAAKGRGLTDEQAEETVGKILPTFRKGRSTASGAAIRDLLDDFLDEEVDDEEMSADDAETVDADAETVAAE